MRAICYLSSKGYGSITELKKLDTTEFLDIIEYETINAAIELYKQKQAEK